MSAVDSPSARAAGLLSQVAAEKALRDKLQLRWLEALEETAELLVGDSSGSVAHAIAQGATRPQGEPFDTQGWAILSETDQRLIADAWIDACLESERVEAVDFGEISGERRVARRREIAFRAALRVVDMSKETDRGLG